MPKRCFVDQLKDGDRIDDPFLVKSARLAETRAGKPYLILTVADKSGEISGPVWDNVEQLGEKCQPGSFIRLLGLVQSYREKLQLKVDAVERLELLGGCLGVEASDGEEAVGGEHVAQHFPIAGLEDVEGEKRLREKSQIGQGHDGDFVGHHNFHLHVGKRRGRGGGFQPIH